MSHNHFPRFATLGTQGAYVTLERRGLAAGSPVGDLQPVGDVIRERGPSPTGLPAIAHDSIGDAVCLDEGRALADVPGREPAFASRRLFGRNSSLDMVTTRSSILFPIRPFMPP